jgi:hypothetical protein
MSSTGIVECCNALRTVSVKSRSVDGSQPSSLKEFVDRADPCEDLDLPIATSLLDLASLKLLDLLTYGMWTFES